MNCSSLPLLPICEGDNQKLIDLPWTTSYQLFFFRCKSYRDMKRTLEEPDELVAPAPDHTDDFYAKCTAKELYLRNVRTASSPGTGTTEEACKKIVTNVASALRWTSQGGPLFADVCRVTTADFMTGVTLQALAKPHVRADYLCGFPAYANVALQDRGFHTCVTRTKDAEWMLRASLVPFSEVKAPPPM